MTKENEFISTLESELTPEQVEQLLHDDSGKQGDTANADANDNVPNIDDNKQQDVDTLNAAESKVGNSEVSEEKLNADNAVILAKDGKHTIGYEKLVEARQQAQQAKQQAEEAMQELERLRADAQQRAIEGEAPTAQDNQSAIAEKAIEAGVDPELFGDFSEEALAAGINKLVAQQVEQRIAEAMQPLKAKEAESAADAHYNAIYEAHPDADSIIESQELADWKASLPSFTREAVDKVLSDGSTEQIIELFDSFKAATGTQSSKPKGEDVREAAKRTLANQRAPVPPTLTDFPAGRSAPSSKADAMGDMSATELVDTMADMTPDQIEQYLNRL